jgi:hypothetical protein
VIFRKCWPSCSCLGWPWLGNWGCSGERIGPFIATGRDFGGVRDRLGAFEELPARGQTDYAGEQGARAGVFDLVERADRRVAIKWCGVGTPTREECGGEPHGTCNP